MENKWTFNNQESEVWSYDEFDTKEEAIKAGIEYAKDDEWEELFVGQIKQQPIPCCVDAERVIEKIGESIDELDDCDCGYSDNFFDSLKTQQVEDLESMLEETFYKWVEKYNIKSHAFTIENIIKINLSEINI